MKEEQMQIFSLKWTNIALTASAFKFTHIIFVLCFAKISLSIMVLNGYSLLLVDIIEL